VIEKKAIIKPFIAARRFNSTAGAGTGVGAAYNILATAFSNDTGAAATAFPVPTYYNLYINSMIQEGSTSTITTTAITIPDGDTLDPATPIIVEIVVT
jgi:hypothetical protein